MNKITWQNQQEIESQNYQCGHCGKSLASNRGFVARDYKSHPEYICICHSCHKPTYLDNSGGQFPGVAFGNPVNGIDDSNIKALYEEARNCASIKAFTSAAMACRKILMNIGVAKGAKDNLTFSDYVQYLSAQNYVPPDGKEWVTHIKDKGNDANHKIEIFSKKDAEDLLYFTEMLLTFIYTVPDRFKKIKSELPANKEK